MPGAVWSCPSRGSVTLIRGFFEEENMKPICVVFATLALVCLTLVAAEPALPPIPAALVPYFGKEFLSFA